MNQNGYSQEQLADILGKDRRAIRDLIDRHGIEPIEHRKAKDGRQIGRYRASDLFAAIDPDRFADISNIASSVGFAMLQPQSNMISKILHHLPEGIDPVEALKEIIEAGWDDVYLMTGRIP